ncbi:MAG: sulfatase-like hydrolase/transferase [Phycisphaerae bacterium]|nr:sulfatase-like hydrolase/transferase [Phycisphaerae bacterium]NIP54383.1 sulfatase-like hydrolase/transferase [Phycisphaerae bacterium]NIS53242.1 sulfatase-like hydrolase/transferase [Phycisphaerae bacterium]NIU10768.1 sulfatase-like hydrolase/transferase [Phycisphaerae bacterium]NIU58563.1 sulfatase-like hydrolase/transferase [Phycisphaerae bacterium]
MVNYSRRDFLKAAGLQAAIFAIPGCTNNAKQSANKKLIEKPNILWITCEDMNPYLGCYCDTYAITPNLDKLAAEGVLYTNAYATAPVCAPARSCLVTGMYATSLGTQHLRSDVKLPKQIKCFPQYLRKYGYYCSNNSKKDYNFTDIEVWDESSKTAHWRKRKPGQPFFSVFNFTSTHQGQINGTDEEFFAKYRSKLKPQELHDPAEVPLPPYYPDTPMVRKIWTRYYDLITFMDNQVGDLLGQLEDDGLADNTIVFFFADHGLGVPRHKRTLYDSGLHVPLIIRFPARFQNLAPLKAGRRIDRLVSFVDFAPTVLSLAGLPKPNYMQGRAFLGVWAGQPREYIFGASSRVDEVYEMSRSVRDKRYKYIRNYMPHLPYIQPSEYPDRADIMKELRRVVKEDALNDTQKLLWQPAKLLEELYDTLTDPHEINNLADSAQHQHILERMRKEHRKWMAATFDIGLLPEGQMHIQAEGSTPYEIAQDPRKFPQQRILETAQLVKQGPEVLPKLIKLLEDNDAGVRYWAAVAIGALGDEAGSAKEALTKALTDEDPVVRFTAASALCKLDMCENALPVLAKGLEDKRETVVLHAAREIQSIGDKARPIVEQIKQAQAECKKPDGTYRNNNHAMFIDWALKYALQNCQL